MKILIAACVIILIVVGYFQKKSAIEINDVMQATQEQIIQKMGNPSTKTKFLMKDAEGEFRIELQNTYPLNIKANESVEIQEWTWITGEERITLWFHLKHGQWEVFHGKEWNAHADF